MEYIYMFFVILLLAGVAEPTINEELRNLITEGKTPEAIKRYREVTGLGLKEAKDYVDSLLDLRKME